MKLLIVTQVIDINHPILGFFHRWVEEFAKQSESVTVICQAEGKHNLPGNVKVFSLGKESGKSKIQQLFNFYRYLWQERKNYDVVFVHMIPLYVILGGPLWRLLGKKVGLWYAHGTVTLMLRIAILFSNHVFTSTREGLQVETKKRIMVGQGIDTALFKYVDKTLCPTLRLITVGRVAPSKNIDTLLHACALLRDKRIDFSFEIVGDSITEKERSYQQEMRELATQLNLDTYVEWVGPVSQEKLPKYLQQSDIFIHDGSTNSLDKTLLEAALCGCVVVSSNPAFQKIASQYTPEFCFTPKDYKSLHERIMLVRDFALVGHTGATALRKYIENQFTLHNLISGIVQRI